MNRRQLDTVDNALSIADSALNAREKEAKTITKRWNIDMGSDSWLSKNIRPILALLFSVTFIIGCLCGLPVAPMEAPMLMIIGAYFTSRGVEKIMKDRAKAKKETQESAIKAKKEIAKMEESAKKSELKSVRLDARVAAREARRRKRSE